MDFFSNIKIVLLEDANHVRQELSRLLDTVKQDPDAVDRLTELSHNIDTLVKHAYHHVHVVEDKMHDIQNVVHDIGMSLAITSADLVEYEPTPEKVSARLGDQSDKLLQLFDFL